ncbi:mediator of RNA polymerase II transcription subunit 15a-like [Benincasa hispida]|uniref:mediator of RNA polymerase II transcription subunit 15a-like n=1 Tax=Benincasa hispida TaxID=102211 RepID=UPI001901A655|nr:mediator of RNA polymerase II transcription subunit 15a-like [Benincasa hispida]
MKRRRTMLPGLPENGRADYEEALNDFLYPQMVNDAIQAEKAFIVSSPGMPPSAFLEEVVESVHENDICCVTPLQRLIKMVNEMSPKALSASVSDIDSLVCMTDRVSSSAPLNNSKAAVGAYLVGADSSPLRRKCSRFGGTIGSRRTRHYRSLMDCEGFDLNSSTIETPDHSHWHGFSLPEKQSLFEEIRRINEQLIDTVVSICDKDTITIDRSEGIIVKCSFVAMCAHSNLNSHQTSAPQLVYPLKLLVPKGYPHISPIFNKFHYEACPTGCEDLSLQAREKFNMSVRSLAHPFSISQVARIWDVCARDVVSEYARRNGGGSFSSKYGSWEDCLHAAWS